MRVKKTLINGIYAFGSSLLIFLIAVLVRRFFLKSFTEELLGYEGLFGNLFSLLSISELGIAGALSYRIYSAYAQNDNDEIAKLIGIYKYLYVGVGIVVFSLGMLLSPFLRFFVKDVTLSWNKIYFYYFIQLFTVVCSYFLSYRRILFEVSLNEYKCVAIETVVSILTNVAKIAVILLTGNYILYLLITLLSSVTASGIIFIKSKKDFSYLGSDKISFKDVKQTGLLKDVKNNLIQRLCGAIYGGTDNIIISSFLGIIYVGRLSNYLLIANYVTTVLSKLFNSFRAAIGNYIYTENKKDITNIFKMFDLLSFFAASFVGISYFVLFNRVISFSFGEKYLLEISFVFVFSLNQYIKYTHEFACLFRQNLGKFEMDNVPIFIGTIMNLALSIILVQRFGIVGVFIGTIAGHLGYWYGRINVLYKTILEEKIWKYYLRQVRNIILFLLELFICYNISDRFPSGIAGIVMCIALCIVVPNSINLILFCRTSEMSGIKQYIKYSLSVMKNKSKKQSEM